jgi:hypothetical protein
MSISTKKGKISTVTLKTNDLKELERLLSDLDEVEYTFEAKDHEKTVSKIDALSEVPVSCFKGMSVYARGKNFKRVEIRIDRFSNEFTVRGEDQNWVTTKYLLLREFFKERENKNWLIKRFPTGIMIWGSIITLAAFSLLRVLHISLELKDMLILILLSFWTGGVVLSGLFDLTMSWIVIEINHRGKISPSAILEGVIAGLIVLAISYLILWFIG